MLGNPIDHFEYERRFYCTSIPDHLLADEKPTLIVQSYFVHEDNYALRIRLQAKNVRIDLDDNTDPMAV